MKLTLTQIRSIKNLSIDQVATDTDIPVEILVEYEKKPHIIPLPIAIELANYFKMKLNKIKWLP